MPVPRSFQQASHTTPSYRKRHAQLVGTVQPADGEATTLQPQSGTTSIQLKAFRQGATQYTQETAEHLLSTYYQTNASLAEACRRASINYNSARRWLREIPEFREAINDVKELVKEEIHRQYMTKVLDEDEKNPAWKIFYLKNHFPEYADKKSQTLIQLHLTDSAVRQIEAKVTGPNEPATDRTLDTPAINGEVTDAGEVS